MTPVPAVALHEVTKDFVIGVRGVRLRAVDQLSLEINAGEVFGLLGPNGGGKSTTLKMILGFMRPTSGTCEIFGVASERTEARASVGYLPEAPDFYRYLSGRELVTFYANLCGLRGRETRQRVADVIEKVGLTHAADRRVGTYSKGMLQRIGLAQAIVHDPKLLILDEPTAGVDPVAAEAMCQLLLTLKNEGKTIVITSHLLGQIEELCDRVAILGQGKLVVTGRVSDLTRATKGDGQVRLPPLSTDDRRELNDWLQTRGYGPATSEANRPRLDRVFCEYVRRSGVRPLAS